MSMISILDAGYEFARIDSRQREINNFSFRQGIRTETNGRKAEEFIRIKDAPVTPSF